MILILSLVYRILNDTVAQLPMILHICSMFHFPVISPFLVALLLLIPYFVAVVISYCNSLTVVRYVRYGTHSCDVWHTTDVKYDTHSCHVHIYI